MNKKNVFRVMAIVIALAVAGGFVFCDVHSGMSPLTKFFVVFFGAVIGLQCIPAILLFAGMIRGFFVAGESRANQISR